MARSKKRAKNEGEVIRSMEQVARGFYDQIKRGTIPNYSVPSRTKSNIVFDEGLGVWKYGTNKVSRSAKKLSGAYGILKSLYVMDFIKEMISSGKSSTLRELYYISEGWDLAKFSSQADSNKLAEDLEIITKHMREDFKLRPEEDGARLIGNITLRERNRKGEMKTFNCRDDVGDSGYSIPYNVDPEKVVLEHCDANFVIAIETGGMFDRLVENGFDEEYGAVLLHLKGQPARSTRTFLKRLNLELKLPVVIFTDGDPWSYRIYASVAYGAIKTAHISEYLATPSAVYLGITPSDIKNYDLPTDDLTRQDIKALKSELEDPRFKDAFWQGEIKYQLKMKKKAEQQALAKYGLDFVTDTYLPEKLAEMNLL